MILPLNFPNPCIISLTKQSSSNRIGAYYTTTQLLAVQKELRMPQQAISADKFRSSK